MRTTIRLNEVLARRMKELASRTDRSFTDLVEEAVADLVAKHSSSARPRKIVLPTYGDPNNKISEEEYKAAVEQADLEYDLKKIGKTA